jgi:hypothetical protein
MFQQYSWVLPVLTTSKRTQPWKVNGFSLLFNDFQWFFNGLNQKIAGISRNFKIHQTPSESCKKAFSGKN